MSTDDTFNGEVRINKDISKYGDQVLLGLSLKQTICAACAVVVAIAVFALTNRYLGFELATTLCAVSAVPIGAIGFIKYNGMSLPQLVKAIILHYSMPENLCFRAKNYYAELIALNKEINRNSKEKAHDQNIQSDETA